MKKNKTVKELFLTISRDDFLGEMEINFPEMSAETQWDAFQEILKIQPKNTINILVVDKIRGANEITLVTPEGNFSTSLTSISEYLNCGVLNQTELNDVQLACFLFYDMTFFGYSDEEIEIAKKKMEIDWDDIPELLDESCFGNQQ